jgi:hypothetical protein
MKIKNSAAALLAVSMGLGSAYGLDLSTEQKVKQIIADYSPVVWFHGEEQYFTHNVDAYLNSINMLGGVVSSANSYDNFKQEHVYYWSADHINRYGINSSQASLKNYISSRHNVPRGDVQTWFKIADQSIKAGDVGATKTYVVANEDPLARTLTLEYNYFYPYNGPGRFEVCMSGNDCSNIQSTTVGRHQGDWESVNLVIDTQTDEVKKVYLSAHGDLKESKDDILFWNRHPYVYSAKYSHAFYPQGGRVDYERVWSKDYWLGTASVDLFDVTGSASYLWSPYPNGYQVIKSNMDVFADTLIPEWVTYSERWGFNEKLKHSVSITIFGGSVYTYDYKEVGRGPNKRIDNTPKGATLFKHPNYQGYAITLDTGSYTIAQLSAQGIPNDDVSSIHVPSGYKVDIYQHDNFGGWVRTYYNDIPGLGSGDNQISSVRVSKL